MYLLVVRKKVVCGNGGYWLYILILTIIHACIINNNLIYNQQLPVFANYQFSLHKLKSYLLFDQNPIKQEAFSPGPEQFCY